MATKNNKDAELIDRYKNGDNEAFGVIATKYRSPIITMLYGSGIKDTATAEDILQDTLVKAMKAVVDDTYVHGNNTKAWLQRIAFNQAMDYHRKKYRIPTLPGNAGVVSRDKNTSTNSETTALINRGSLLSDQDDNPEESFIRMESEERLAQIHFDAREVLFMLFEKLPAEQEQILRLRYFSSLSFKEIAEIEKIPLGTALGRARNALNKIRKIIRKIPKEITEGLRQEIR